MSCRKGTTIPMESPHFHYPFFSQYAKERFIVSVGSVTCLCLYIFIFFRSHPVQKRIVP